MKGCIDHEYDTEEGEVFDLEIEYHYVPYVPATWTDPADGGGCEEIIFKVVGYRQTDDEGNIILDLPKLTPDQSKGFTDTFDKMVNNNQRLYDYFQDLCTKNAEDKRDDYDD